MQPPQTASFDPDAAFGQALLLQQTGDDEAACALYERILQAVPSHPMVPHLLGVALVRLERDLFLARRLIQTALVHVPDDKAAAANLAAVDQRIAALPRATGASRSAATQEALQAIRRCREAGRNREALSHAEQALAEAPDDTDLLTLRAFLLQTLEGSPQACLACLDRALHLRPDDHDALQGRASVLSQLKLFGEAVRDYDTLIALQPADHELHTRRGHALFELKRMADAGDAYREALRLGGDEAVLRYALAALGEGERPDTAPAQYVVGLFDGYAEKFDQHLTGTLNYRGPELLAAALERLGLPGGLQVLDLGCGTGLCGPWLRPLARRLVGIDLSPKMLALARQRSLYDELHCRSIADYLREDGTRHDVVAAADVFIYVGDLAPVFAALRPRLSPGAAIAFTTETLQAGDFALLPTRRYAHSEAYLRRLAAEHGLQWLALDPCVLRRDGSRDVHGHVAVLRAPGALAPDQAA